MTLSLEQLENLNKLFSIRKKHGKIDMCRHFLRPTIHVYEIGQR